MNYDELYMIEKDSYDMHLNLEATMYSVIQALTEGIRNLPNGKGITELKVAAADLGKRTAKIVEDSGLPTDCAPFDNAFLNRMADEELIEPEDAGYYSEECYEDCDDFYDYDDDYEDDYDDFFDDTDGDCTLTEKGVKDVLKMARGLTDCCRFLLHVVETHLPE